MNKNLIPVLVAGYPSLDEFKSILKKLDKYVDTMIIAMPFADSIIEGEVIYKANNEVLAKGISIDDIINSLLEVRLCIKAKLIFKAYANTIYAYDSAKFISLMHKLDIQALMVNDLPYEENAEFIDELNKYDIELINTIATLDEERKKMIIDAARHYIYYLPSSEKIKDEIEDIKRRKDLTILMSDSELAYQYADRILASKDMLTMIQKDRIDDYFKEF